MDVCPPPFPPYDSIESTQFTPPVEHSPSYVHSGVVEEGARSGGGEELREQVARLLTDLRRPFEEEPSQAQTQTQQTSQDDPPPPLSPPPTSDDEGGASDRHAAKPSSPPVANSPKPSTSQSARRTGARRGPPSRQPETSTPGKEAELYEKFMQEVAPYRNRVLTEDEWDQFETTVDSWAPRLVETVRKLPPQHNTTWWRKRQR